jgi:hypothetical protein
MFDHVTGFFPGSHRYDQSSWMMVPLKLHLQSAIILNNWATNLAHVLQSPRGYEETSVICSHK